MFNEIDAAEAIKLEKNEADKDFSSGAFPDAIMHYSRMLDHVSRIPDVSFSDLNLIRYPAVAMRAKSYHKIGFHEQAVMDYNWQAEILLQETQIDTRDRKVPLPSLTGVSAIALFRWRSLLRRSKN